MGWCEVWHRINTSSKVERGIDTKMKKTNAQMIHEMTGINTQGKRLSMNGWAKYLSGLSFAGENTETIHVVVPNITDPILGHSGTLYTSMKVSEF